MTINPNDLLAGSHVLGSMTISSDAISDSSQVIPVTLELLAQTKGSVVYLPVVVK
ncbi:hypothetical protein QUF63_02155 [Anaerolineales bacterium HSG25]|nr:hypothetical protein [Anaerolineales bacterium HSG25]